MKNLSVVIVSHNEESNIIDCLKSIAWAEEIILIDGKSSDKTVEVARNYTKDIYIVDNDVCEVNRIIGVNKACGEWILFLDADERVTPGLKVEICKAIGNKSSINSYRIYRENYFYGKKVHYGSPDYHLRLFKKEEIKVLPDKIHRFVEINGRESKLKGKLLHFPFRKISDHIKKAKFYAETESNYLLVEKKVNIRWYNLGWYFVVRPLGKFFQSYIVMKGWMDGVVGIVISALSAYYEFLKYVKYWRRTK